jgi:O-antigen/teichoic acid export membrane protein
MSTPEGVPSVAASPSTPPGPSALEEETTRLLGGGSLVMMASTLAFFVLTFVGYVIAARILPVSGWGEFILGVSFTSFLSVVIILGLNSAVARCLVLEHDASGRLAIVRWSLWVSGVASIAASVATFVFAAPLANLFHQPALTPVFELLAASVGLGAITPMFCAVFQGFQDMLPNALYNQVLNPAVFVVLVVGLFAFGWRLDGALVAYLVADILGFVASVAYYLRHIEAHLPAGTRAAPRPPRVLWTSAVALWGVGSLAFITAYADTLLLGAFRTATSVGYYSTAIALARTLLLAVAALTFVFLPLSARLARHNDFARLRSSYTVSVRWIVIVSLPLFLLFALLPSESIVAIFGVKYLPATTALQVLSITAFASSVVGPSNAYLAGLARDRAQLLTTGFSAAVNVGLSVTLIPVYGLLGAALAWGIARALYPALSLGILARDYQIHPFRPALVRPVALTLALTVPTFLAVRFLLPIAWLVYPLFFFALGAFLLSLVVTRSFLPDDLAFVSASERLLRTDLPRIRALVTARLDPAPTA